MRAVITSGLFLSAGTSAAERMPPCAQKKRDAKCSDAGSRQCAPKNTPDVSWNELPKGFPARWTRPPEGFPIRRTARPEGLPLRVILDPKTVNHERHHRVSSNPPQYQITEKMKFFVDKNLYYPQFTHQFSTEAPWPGRSCRNLSRKVGDIGYHPSADAGVGGAAPTVTGRMP